MKNIIENVGPKTDLRSLEYRGRGESVYVDGRQVLVRTCHDAFVGYPNGEGKKGIILVKRKEEPAKDYFWCFGGGIERGIPMLESLARNVKEESGLEIYKPLLLNVERCIWNETPNKNTKEKGLPGGVDDVILVFYCEGKGNINLNKLHEEPLIVTPEMYTPNFREKLYPYVQRGMDLSLPFIKQ